MALSTPKSLGELEAEVESSAVLMAFLDSAERADPMLVEHLSA